jgi:ankyrin repeat protein
MSHFKKKRIVPAFILGTALSLSACSGGGDSGSSGSGSTAIAPASRSIKIAGNKHALSWLLAHKVDVTKRNEKSLTALMITCQNDRADLATLLIEAGAKINRRNKQGKNCLEQAKEADAAEVIALINGLK